jgi:murein DD-endopeptidase MepM/ murein hydrolase activator NlpD
VNVGDYVVQGQLIGYMGSTGNSSGNHLHFTVFYNGSTVNPMDLL